MRFLIVIILLLLIGSAAYFLLTFDQSPFKETPTPSPTATKQVLCEPEQLSGTITPEAAAGNIYATLVLTNTSDISCNVTLGQSVTATYEAKNITLSYKPAPTPFEITLQPKNKVYSQVHYPNGPQCSGATVETSVRFLYEVDGKTVPFGITADNDATLLQTCSTATEMTQIDIWPLSLQKISQ